MNARIVHLAECDDGEYADFASRQVVEYASQLARAGEVPSERSFSVRSSNVVRARGRAILDAVEQYELTRGSQAIWLRVFDWNTVARRLYQSHGYDLARHVTVDAHFCKPLRR